MSITPEQLKAEELRLQYLELLADPSVYPTRANWQFICDNAMPGLGELLYTKYLSALRIEEADRAELYQIAVEEFPKYLMAVDRDYALQIVYSDTMRNPEAAAALIVECQLFDADYMANLVDCGEQAFVANLLLVYQPEYEPEHLESMRVLSRKLHSLPTVGHVEERRGIFGVSRKYVCPDGHTSDENAEYCSHCGKNAQGLTAKHIKQLAVYDHRVKALANLLG